MTARYSAYVPCCNNGPTLRAAVESLLAQRPVPPAEVVVVDDGSADDPAPVLAGLPIRLIRHRANLGRGAARRTAMEATTGELVLCCDATNVLPPDFFAAARRWFEDPGVAGVSGPLRDPQPRGAAGRWRARHLFRQDALEPEARRDLLFVTSGAVLRRAASDAVGGYDPAFSQCEDADLGRRLLAAGHHVVYDPSLSTLCNIRNTASQVLSRYARWNYSATSRGYLAELRYAVFGLMRADLRAGDWSAALISLWWPHYQWWSSRRARRTVRPSAG